METLEATLLHLSEKVDRRLREHGLHARTIQLKLRYSDFSTITRAHSFDHATQLDTEIFQQVRRMMHENRKAGAAIRLLGVHAAGFEIATGQLDLLAGDGQERWRNALAAVDRLRDRFGEDSVSLAAGLKGRFRERVHENPADRPK